MIVSQLAGTGCTTGKTEGNFKPGVTAQSCWLYAGADALLSWAGLQGLRLLAAATSVWFFIPGSSPEPCEKQC